MAELLYALNSYTPPGPNVKPLFTPTERTQVATVVATALANGPLDLHDIVVLLLADGTLTGATKAKIDGDRVLVALNNAVTAGNLKVI